MGSKGRDTYGKFASVPSTNPSNSNQAGMSPEVIMEMVLDFLKRKGLPAIFLGLIMAAGALYGTYRLIDVQFMATATIVLQPPENVNDQQFKQTELDRIKTSSILNLALEEEDVLHLSFNQKHIDQVQALRKALSLKTSPISNIVEVNIESTDPYEAKILANAVANAYEKYSVELLAEEIKDRRKRYDGKFTDVIDELETMKTNREQQLKEVGLADPKSVEDILMMKLQNKSEVDKALYELNMQMTRLESELAAMKEEIPEIDTQSRIKMEDEIANVDEALDEAKNYREEVRKQLLRYLRADQQKEFDEGMSAANSEVESLIAKKERIINAYNDVAKSNYDQKLSRLKINIRLLTDQIKQVDNRKIALQDAINDLQNVVGRIEACTREIDLLNEEKKEIEKELQKIDDDSTVDYIRAVELAELPKIPHNELKRYAMIGMSGAAAFGLVILVFWLFDIRLRLVRNIDQLQRAVSIPVIGELPYISGATRLPPSIDQISRKKRLLWELYQEGVNSIRVTLTVKSGGDVDPKCILVSSPRDSEGKSTFACNLAISTARAGYKTLLIDGDFHRPVLDEAFCVNEDPGFVDILKGNEELENAVNQTQYPGLDLLTCGKEESNLDILLSQDRLEPFIKELKANYSMIILDAPPILPVYDSLIFAQLVDSCVMVSMSNYSQIHTIQKSIKRFQTVGIDPDGIILAGTSAPDTGGEYYYYGYSHTRLDEYELDRIKLPKENAKEPKEKESSVS